MPGRRPPRCSLRGCKRTPRWYPFVYVPIARLESAEPESSLALSPRPIPRLAHKLLVIPLPMIVCDAHKLPHRVEAKLLASRRFRELLARHLAEQGSDWLVRLNGAWVIHEPAADLSS